jgi:hypothetical protein
MAMMSRAERFQEELFRRILQEGGFADRPQGQYRVDATAWAILACQALDVEGDLLERHRARLVRQQGQDGRIWLSPEHPESYWPTTLAVLAWNNSSASLTASNRAVHFLLESSGEHYPRKPKDALGHDPLLKGWAWIGGTHSWIEPTALAVMALKTTGNGQHDRVREAIRMMLDRQLPHGGWNYGNTSVFGRELHPMPESTGAALAALAGQVELRTVSPSLDYLQDEVGRLRTPISLGWGLLGLAAWERPPSNGKALVERCLANQARYGPYDTSALCLLLLGTLAMEAGAKIPLFSDADRDISAPALRQ